MDPKGQPDAKEQPALDLSEFRFTFDIRQQDSQSPNTAIIRVFNLSIETVRQIQTAYIRVVLQVGYAHTTVGVIFDGTIVQTRRGRERNVDSYLDILATEGDLPYTFAVINQTFAPGVTSAQLMEAYSKVLGGYGTPITDNKGLIGGTLPRGKVAFGMAIDYFSQLCITTGHTWVIQNGKIVAIPLTGYLPGEAVVLNSQSGLIGQPEATQQGVTLRCLINPKIRVGTRVQIANYLINETIDRGPGIVPNYANPFAGAYASVTEDGFYRVLVCEYEGDSRGQAWYQDLICLAIDPSVKPEQSVQRYP